MFDISIVTPVYNTPEYMAKCLDSVQVWINKSQFKSEHIVVDDGSNDDTPLIIKRHIQNYTNTRLISLGTNQGQSAARNVGVKSAKGGWLFFIDSDDYLLPAGFEEFLARLIKGNIDFAYGDFRAVDINGKHIDEHDYYGHQFASSGECLSSMYKGEHFFQQNFAIKKMIFDSVAGYDEGIRIGEDFELCTRFLLAGYNPIYIPGVLYNHVIRDDSLSAGYRSDKSRHKQSIKILYELHRDKLQNLGVYI